MNKRDSSKKAAVKRVPLPKILAGQMFLALTNEKRDVQEMTASAFDAWADSLVEEIAGVNREVWDVFARWRFLNHLLAEGVLAMREENETIVLSETEEKTSAIESDDPLHKRDEAV